jgi:hypothetical protein
LANWISFDPFLRFSSQPIENLKPPRKKRRQKAQTFENLSSAV